MRRNVIAESRILRETMLALSALRCADGKTACRVWRQQVGTFLAPTGVHVVKIGVKGQSDIGGVMRGGRCLQVEIKSESGTLRDEQEKWGAMIDSMGGLFVVCRSAAEAVAAVRAVVDAPDSTLAP